MTDTKKEKETKPKLDQEKGDEVLRRMLKTPPKPHGESNTKKTPQKKAGQGLDEKKEKSKE